MKPLDSSRHSTVARQLQNELMKELPLVHEKLVRAGLFSTSQKMHDVVREAGYELSELIKRRTKFDLYGYIQPTVE